MPVVCQDSTKDTFRGKTVLLTGASGGLGRSLALQLAQCQVDTLILSSRTKQSLDKVADECRSLHPSVQIQILPCDLSSKESVAQLASNEICQTVDVLVNCGGVSSRSTFVETSLQVDEKLMQINFLAGAALAKAVVPGMMQRKQGIILWISSVQGLVGIPGRTSYAASKFAVQGYCEALRAEVASSGVRVHVASPGYIRTNLSKSAITGDGSAHGKMDATTAAGADPDQVAVEVLDSVAKNKADFVVAASFSAVAAIWMRLLCPSLLRSLLVKRHDKATKEKSD